MANRYPPLTPQLLPLKIANPAQVPGLVERQRLFERFLGRPVGAFRAGTYRALSFGRGQRRVRVLILDTRSARDPHALPSVGAWFRGIPVRYGPGSRNHKPPMCL